MTPLALLQQRMGAAIAGRDASLLDGLLGGAPELAAARFGAYVDNHHLGLRDALAAIYPVVRRLLGEDCFDLLAREHVARQPKPSGNVLDYGAHLPEQIDATEGLSGLPYLGDVARLEWLLHEIGRAADCAPERALSLTGLLALDEAGLAGLRLQLVPAARLYRSRFPVLRIWQGNQQSEATPVSLDEGGVKCVLLRTGLQLRFESLTAGEFAFLDALAERPACAAAEIALAVDPRLDLAATFARSQDWLQHAGSRSAP